VRRRAFITLLGGAVAWPLGVGAQQLVKIPLIAALMPFVEGDEEAERRRNAFERGLRQLGWTNGQNIRIEYRWVAADRDRIRDAAIEIVGLKPDVIVVSTALLLAPLQQRTTTIPIVFTHITDPVSSHIVASLARPGGN
jgi:putative tryptophan/tyrosine transport system substrate-binding protein